MGFRQVRKYFNPSRIQWQEQLVTKTGEHLSLPMRIARRLTREWLSRPPAQYMLEDWLAERSLVRLARSSTPPDIIQYLDGEHSFRHALRWIKRGGNRPKLAAMFHMPPDRLAPMIELDQVSNLDAVLVVAPDQADWFRTWMDPARVHLVLHGIDDEFFHPAENPDAISIPPWKVITVGANFRDYHVVFSVARQFVNEKDVEFHVVRKFPEGADIPPNVRVHSGISDQELADLYRQSHISLLPLTQATASNTLQEAMASGIPTIASDLPSLRAYSPGGETLFFSPGDVASAAAHVRDLLKDSGRRMDLGRRARTRVESINWNASANAMDTIYQSLMGQQT